MFQQTPHIDYECLKPILKPSAWGGTTRKAGSVICSTAPFNSAGMVLSNFVHHVFLAKFALTSINMGRAGIVSRMCGIWPKVWTWRGGTGTKTQAGTRAIHGAHRPPKIVGRLGTNRKIGPERLDNQRSARLKIPFQISCALIWQTYVFFLMHCWKNGLQHLIHKTWWVDRKGIVFLNCDVFIPRTVAV